MKKGIKTRKSRFENLEERLMMAVAAGGFASAAECVASEAVNDEFIPISLGEPLQTAACPCDNPLPAPTILTGSNGYYVSYGQNNHLIAWSEVENAAGYELEYVNGKGEWFTVKTTEDHAVVANLAYGTNVTYRVRALGDAIYGSSAWSAAKSFNVCPMDIDEDGLIGPDDYALLSSAWFSAEDGANWNPCCDIDGDGFVGPGDFSYLSSNWLAEIAEDTLNYPATGKSPVITGITIKGYSGLYDGSGHQISVSGTEAGDTVLYSTDGTTYSTINPSFTEVGKYTVYVKVSRTNYNDWTGSAVVEITEQAAAPLTYTLSQNGRASTGDGSVAEDRHAIETTELYLDFDEDPGAIDPNNISFTTGGTYIESTDTTPRTAFLVSDTGKYRIVLNVHRTGTASDGIDDVAIQINQSGIDGDSKQVMPATYMPIIYWGTIPFQLYSNSVTFDENLLVSSESVYALSGPNIVSPIVGKLCITENDWDAAIAYNDEHGIMILDPEEDAPYSNAGGYNFFLSYNKTVTQITNRSGGVQNNAYNMDIQVSIKDKIYTGALNKNAKANSCSGQLNYTFQ